MEHSETLLERFWPAWSLGNGLRSPAGVQHRRSWIQEKLVERSLSEKLLEFSVTHLLQSLNITVVQSIGAPVWQMERFNY